MVVVSDACLGYGSPQIPLLARSVAASFGGPVAVIEPDVQSTPPLHKDFPDLPITRVTTRRHVYEGGGRAEYLERAAALINAKRPDILIVCCSFCLPVLLRLRYRPQLVIYYAIESIIQYGQIDTAMHHAVADMIDFVIFPEENRAALDGARTAILRKPFAIVLNSANGPECEGVIPSSDRNGRIIHQGTIGVKQTLTHYFLDRRIQRLPIDVFGPIVDVESEALRRPTYPGSPDRAAGVVYRGRVPLAELSAIRAHYAFSVCIWSPSDERGRFAPSNKFFEAIASGVPPITAPHPQHVRLTRQFDCGIVMDSWDFTDFRRALVAALRVYGTPRYDELVANCLEAAKSQLNWPTQMDPVLRQLAVLLAERAA